MIIVDQLNRRLTFKEPPKRIISLVPSLTETLHFLNLDEEVVGITKFCVHPKEWKDSKTIIGGTKKVNFKKIKNLKPDLIIANKEENTKEEIEELIKNYPVYISNIKSFKDLENFNTDIGLITKEQEKAKTLNQSIKKVVCETQNFFNSLGQNKVAYFIWQNPFMLAGKDTFINHILNHIGFENIANTLKSRYPEVSINDINPADIILLSSEPYPFKKKHLKDYSVQFNNSNIFIVDGEVFSWYGPRILLFTAELCRLKSLLN